jgi:hypothetical protein
MASCKHFFICYDLDGETVDLDCFERWVDDHLVNSLGDYITAYDPDGETVDLDFLKGGLMIIL